MPNNKHGHHWIRDEKRQKIYSRDNFFCLWCMKDLLHVQDPHDRTLDHLQPREKGGSNEASNLITACLECNSLGGSQSLEERARQTEERTGEQAEIIIARIKAHVEKSL